MEQQEGYKKSYDPENGSRTQMNADYADRKQNILIESQLTCWMILFFFEVQN